MWSSGDRTSDVGPMLVLCAANNWDDIRLSDRPLAEAMAEHGPILYVDPPLSHLTPRNNPRLRASLEGSRLRHVAPNISRLTPVVTPFAFRNGVVPVTRALVRHRLRSALSTLSHPVGAILTTWLDVDVFDLAPGARHLYWVQDDVTTGAAHWGLDVDRIRQAEQRVASSADIVVTASPLATEEWARRVRVACTLPNGCDPTRFAEAVVAEGEPLPVELPAGRPVAGFVGHLNARSDVDLLKAVVDRGLTLLIVGPVSADAGPGLDDLLSRPEVVAVGPQPFEDLPKWLGAMGVGLLPYRDDEFNRQSFPLKTLEYLVAGLPVVSTPLPASKWLNSPDVAVAADAGEFAGLAERLARTPLTSEDVHRRRAFASTHSWEARAQQLVDLLGGG